MNNARIMIVEDEQIVAKDIQSSLRNLGYLVVAIARRGEEVVLKAAEFSPNLVLMDIRLRGEISGLDAALELQKSFNIPIVYLTAYSDKKTLDKAKLSKPYGFIIKPFAEHDLYTAVELALHKHQMEKELADSEKKLQSLFNNSPDGYFTITDGGWIKDANETFAQLLKYTRDELIGRDFDQYVHESSNEQLKYLLENVKAKAPVQNIKLSIVKKDSSLLPVIINTNIPQNNSQNGIAARISVRSSQTDEHSTPSNSNLVQEIKLTRNLLLTDNQKKVFRQIIESPNLNSIEISKKLGIKRSTVAAIKNKLMKDNYFKSYRLPNYKFLNCELLILISADLNSSQHNKSAMGNLFQELTSIPETVFFLGTSRNFTAIAISKNITEFKRHIDPLLLKYKNNNIIISVTTQFFSYEMSKIENFFDFTKLISNLFELSYDTTINRIKSSKKINKFTKREKEVYYALTKYGYMNDSEIAKETGISRPTISQIRNKLSNSGYIKDINIPEPSQIKHELITHYSINLHHQLNGANIEEIRAKIASFKSTFFLAINTSGITSYHLNEDYSSAHNDYNEIITLLPNNNKETINNTYYPVGQLKMNYVDFSRLLNKILNSPESGTIFQNSI